MGKKLEDDVYTLFNELFNEAEQSGLELEKIRQQLSGYQFGHDLTLIYKDKSNSPCLCLIECKNTDVDIYQVAGKLVQARVFKGIIHHWIVISPTGKIKNDLDGYSRSWNDEGLFEPIQNVQLWSHDEAVEEFFALIPEIHDHYYNTKKTIYPDQESWKQRRDHIVKKWREKLAPVNPLPKAWKSYFLNPSKLFSFSEAGEQDKQTSKSYESLYEHRVPIRCRDEFNNPINHSAEQHIINWVYDKGNQKTLFLLAEFGDGKTYLTYSIARRLINEFIVSPATGVVPLRLTLRDLEGEKFQSFLEERLKSFNATLTQWEDLKQRYSLLVILDGFDEMSVGMDPITIKSNCVRLYKCIRNLKGLKVMITSRSPVFKTIKNELTQRLASYEIMSLEPLDYKKREGHIRKFAADNRIPAERVEKFLRTPDLMDLASKPLFLEMLKDTLLDGKLEKTDGLTIYRRYIEKTLKRKVEFLVERNDIDMVDQDYVLEQIKLLMVEFALHSFEYGKQQDLDSQREFTLSDFKLFQDNRELAERLWKELTSLTPNDIEEAEVRIANRSLLKATEKGFIFCHRSIQEYFVAEGICRLLLELPSEARRYLSQADLTFEVMNFAGQILFEQSSGSKSAKMDLQSNLISIIDETRGKAVENKRLAHLATTAINLYYAAWRELPVMNWGNLVLDKAHLPGADFTGQNLKNVSFQNANLDNAIFDEADLACSNLAGVKFEETESICAMQAIAEGKLCLYALYSDGKVRRWDLTSNQQTEIMSNVPVRITDNFGIGSCDFGTVYFKKNRVLFTHNTQAGVGIFGGVRCVEGVTVFDIDYEGVLYANDQNISLFNLKEQSHVFQNYSIYQQTKAVLLNTSTAFLVDDVDGLRIVSESGIAMLVSEFLQKEDCKEISCISVFSNYDNSYRICLGYENGKLLLFDLSGSLVKIADYDCKIYIKSVSIMDSVHVAYNCADGIIHICQLNEINELEEKVKWRLSIRCKNAILERIEEGVHYRIKQQEQYKKLKSYRDLDARAQDES